MVIQHTKQSKLDRNAGMMLEPKAIENLKQSLQHTLRKSQGTDKND